MNSTGNKAVFLDRDGTINRKAPDGDYIKTWREVEFIAGAIKAVVALNRVGYRVFIVTNQRGVATRKIRIEDLTEIHRRMKEQFAQEGAVITEIYCCPHELLAMCSCRKPQPGMLQRAVCEHGVDLQASWMIGDSMTDIEAGNNAGCRTVLIGVQAPDNTGSKPTLVADDLESAVQQIFRSEMPATHFVHLSHNGPAR